MEKIKIGKIVNAVGLKGEVKVYNYSDSVRAYEETQLMFVGEDRMEIEGFRMQKHMVVLKLLGVDDRNAAEALKGKDLFITEDDLPELSEGEYYVRDLLDMEVVEESGAVLGRITDVIQNSAQDLFEVEMASGKKILIPRVDEFVLDIAVKSRRIVVRLIEGLLDL